MQASPPPIAAAHGLLAFLNNPHSILFWALWAVMLLWQNYAFTEVSRARSSASLKRHMKAAFMSNGVWFLQTLFVYSQFLRIITGEYGVLLSIFSAVFYTAFTMSGSIYAHYRALKKESGKTAVGANSKYAQIPVAEWENIQHRLADLENPEPELGPAAEPVFGDHMGITRS